MRRLRAPGVRHGRNDFPSEPPSSSDVVSGDVVGDQPEAWGQRLGSATPAGFGQLRDRLDDVAKTAQGYGASRSGSIVWRGGGGRDPRGRCGERWGATAPRKQGACGGSGRG